MKLHLKFAAYCIAFIGFSVIAAEADVAFFRAVNVDDDRTVRQLLAEGLNPNLNNPRGQNGLYLAMREGSPKVAELLVAQASIRVDAATADDETPSMMAALRGQLVWVQRLVALGSAVNRPGWTPLHYACSGPDGAEAARFLISRGAHLDAPSPNGTTPLMMAAGYGSEACVEVLLQHGAKTTPRNQRELNAVDFARMGGRDKLAQRLAALPGP